MFVFSAHDPDPRFADEIRQYRAVRKNWTNISLEAEKKGYQPINFHKLHAKVGWVSNLPPEEIYHVGYKFLDIVVSCVRGSQSKFCNQSKVVLYIDVMLYNCYTIKLDNNDVTESGPENGLTLILYVGE